MIWSRNSAVRNKLPSNRTLSFSDLPGSRALFLDYLAGNTGDFFAHDFRSDDALRDVHRRVAKRNYRRDKIVAILERQNRDFGAGDTTLANIGKLRDPSTTAVFTGQQVVLFGGPLFVFYKAALAIKLAASDCRKLDGAVVPIFWLAADDADFDEVATVTLPTAENRLEALRYQPMTLPDNQPMSRLRLDERITEVLDNYERLLPETEFRSEFMRALRESYAPGVGVVAAFARWLSRIFKDQGLILVDPSDPELRQLAIPIFRRELQLREQAARKVEERNRALEGRGYHLQVARPGSYSNLFYYDSKRSRIEFADGGFRVEGKSFTQDELLAQVDSSPETFSPNVFLRGIVQSHIFPTLVYFAGPAEIAYFSQIRDLWEMFDQVPPVIYPRFSATIVEPAIRRLLEKHELDVLETAGDVNQLVNRILMRTFPADFDQRFEAFRQEIKRQMANIVTHLDSTDHGMITNAQRIAGRLEGEINQLEEKVFQAHRKKNQTLRAQIERVAFSLFPDGKLQERAFPLNYYMCKYGFTVVDRLMSEIDCNTTAHHLIDLE